MQTVNFNIHHLTGNGWQDLSGAVTVDETIGLKAGRDEYATARGTIKKLIRENMLVHTSTRATLKVNDKLIEIWIENGKFCDHMNQAAK